MLFLNAAFLSPHSFFSWLIMLNRSDCISGSQWNRFLEFSKDLETPNVVINLSQIKFNFLKLKGAFPFAQIYYAVKANPGEKEGDGILAGPTCGSMDIMYEHTKYRMPISLKTGDRLYWLSTGAYTSTYAGVEFNGFRR